MNPDCFDTDEPKEVTDAMIQSVISNGDKVSRFLAKALKAERAKPKVWDGAPDNSKEVFLYWSIPGTSNVLPGPNYTRELPKSRERLIAEETWMQIIFGSNRPKGRAFDTTDEIHIKEIEAAILEAKGGVE